MRLVVVLGLLVLGASPASSEDTQRITVTVGETVSRDVGWAMGHLCDDDTIVDAEMRNKDPETNLFVVRGKKPGTTLCRAGTFNVENRPTYLFQVVVVAKR